MPQSLAQIYIHLIFSTKNRAPLLHPGVRDDLQGYFTGVLRNLQSPCITVRCVWDHVHLLYLQSKNLVPFDVVEEIKKATSKWLKQQGADFRQFHWQRGYGMFSVSASKTKVVTQYIHNQERRHRKKTFQEEFREFLKEYGVKYDERYVWD